MLKTWRSSSSLDLRQYIKYLIIASGIKLIKGFALHRQFVISLYIGSCAFGTFQALLGEPPRSGGGCFWRNSKCLGGTWRKHQPEPAPLVRARSIFLQIRNGGHYTKKFGLISSRTPNEARAERVVALNQIVRSTNRPATASLHSATPKRKNVPCSFDFRGGGFFLKWKGHFSFWGSALQVFGQCGGASIRTRFCENYFLG